MKYGTSIRVRHFVGRLEKGEEVIESLRKLCFRERIRAAAFKGIGILSSAELQEFVPSMQKYVSRFCADTMFELVSLSGNISTLGNEIIINASAAMSYTLFNQQHIVAGHLLTAKAHVVEFAMVSFDDVVLDRTYDPSTGLPLWNRITTSELAEFAMPEPTPSPAVESPALLSPDTATPADALERISIPVDNLEAQGIHLAAPRREPMVIRRRGSRLREDGSIDGTPSDLLPSIDGELSPAIHGGHPSGLLRSDAAPPGSELCTPSPATPPPAAPSASVTSPSSPSPGSPSPASPLRAETRPSPAPVLPVPAAPTPSPAPALSVAAAPVTAPSANTVDAAANSEPAKRKGDWQNAVRSVKSAEAKARLQLPASAPRPAVTAAADDDDDDFELREGDILDHPMLGECKVSRVEDDDWAFIKVGSKIRKLALKAFEIVPIEGEARHFKLIKKREN